MIFKVLTITNLINSAPLKESARGGFADYQYPRWSTILGWFIFVACIIPIPIVFLVRYIQQYQRIAAERRVISLSLIEFILEKEKAFFFQLQRNSLDSVHPTASNEYPTTPIYLAALTANNSPAETWGPRRRKDQYGIYEHLRSKPANKNISTGQEQADHTTFSANEVNNTNPAFVPDQSNPSYEQFNEINN